MFTNAIVLASSVLLANTVNAIAPSNTMAQMANFREDKFLNLAEAGSESNGINKAPYPTNFGYADYGW